MNIKTQIFSVDLLKIYRYKGEEKYRESAMGQILNNNN